MLSSRPTPHPTAYHAPHKENLYPSSKTPARGGLAIHKDGGARTVGKGAGAKTPFGKGGGLTAVSKGAMTTGRKGLGASLGPGRAAGQDAEGNIAPLRLFQSTCGPSGSTLPHSKSTTFAPAASTKPSFGDVTNGSHSHHAQQPLRTPAPPSKRAAAFATPAPTRGAAKQAVFQTPLPSATRTTRRRSSKLHTPLQQQAAPFSTPTDRTLPADASFELDLAPGPTGGLTDLAEAPAMAEEAEAADELEIEYMPTFSSASYDEPLSLAYEVDDPVELGKAVRAMGVVEQWEQGFEVAYRVSASRSPVGWESAAWETDKLRWTARAGASSDDDGAYDSDEDLAALLNLPLSALKSHQRAASAKSLTIAPAAAGAARPGAPSRRPAGRLGASSAAAVPRRTVAATPLTTVAARQRPMVDPSASSARPAAARQVPAVGPTPRAPTATAAGVVTARLRSTQPPSTASNTTPRPAGLSRPTAAGAGRTPTVTVSTAEREAAAHAQRVAEHRADRAFVLAGLDGLPVEGADDDVLFKLDC